MFRRTVKTSPFLTEYQGDIIGGSITLFCHDQFCHVVHIGSSRIFFAHCHGFTVNEHYHVGILLNCSGLSQLRQSGTLILPARVRLPIQLGKTKHR
jgi:hypothetical protein